MLSIWLQLEHFMPRKTRKDKILASKRKRNLLISLVNTVDSSLSPEKNAYSKPIITTPFATIDMRISKFFIADFKKSLVLIIFIFILEICIYFATMNTYF